MKYLIALLFAISITFSQFSLAASFQDELKEADQGNPAAQFSLGMTYMNGYGVPKDYVEGLKWLKLSTDQGYIYAQSMLGLYYEYGHGVPQDYAEALKWFKLSANSYDRAKYKAQYMLGVLYINGYGVRQDYAEAKEWFGKSCDNGDQMGCERYRELNNL